jgi:hypothetical protein
MVLFFLLCDVDKDGRDVRYRIVRKEIEDYEEKRR